MGETWPWLLISLGDSGAVYTGLAGSSVVNPRPGMTETSLLPLLLVEEAVDGTCIVKQGFGLTTHVCPGLSTGPLVRELRLSWMMYECEYFCVCMHVGDSWL